MNALGRLAERAMRAVRADRAAYATVSAAACAVDFLVTLELTWSGLAPALAAAAGYIAGLGLHWALSIRFVFAPELAGAGAPRSRQASLFVLSGLAGLAVTVPAYSGAMALGAAAAPSKAFAVGLSFSVVYLLRRHVVFPPRA